MSDLVKKALETNGCNFLEFAREPDFNKLTIQKRIDLLNIEISYIQRGAFATKSCNGVTYSGCDIVDLQAKIVLRDSLIENMKTENLRCNCKSKQFTRTVDENSNPLCGGCGKII